MICMQLYKHCTILLIYQAPSACFRAVLGINFIDKSDFVFLAFWQSELICSIVGIFCCRVFLCSMSRVIIRTDMMGAAVYFCTLGNCFHVHTFTVFRWRLLRCVVTVSRTCHRGVSRHMRVFPVPVRSTTWAARVVAVAAAAAAAVVLVSRRASPRCVWRDEKTHVTPSVSRMTSQLSRRTLVGTCSRYDNWTGWLSRHYSRMVERL